MILSLTKWMAFPPLPAAGFSLENANPYLIRSIVRTRSVPDRRTDRVKPFAGEAFRNDNHPFPHGLNLSVHFHPGVRSHRSTVIKSLHQSFSISPGSHYTPISLRHSRTGRARRGLISRLATAFLTSLAPIARGWHGGGD